MDAKTLLQHISLPPTVAGGPWTEKEINHIVRRRGWPVCAGWSHADWLVQLLAYRVAYYRQLWLDAPGE